MNPLCEWRQRALARYAAQARSLPADSALANHLARCERCRRVWDDLRRIAFDLSRTLSAPSPSPTFMADVRERVAAARVPERRPLPLALSAAALCLLILVGVWWIRPGPVVHNSPVERVARQPDRSAQQAAAQASVSNSKRRRPQERTAAVAPRPLRQAARRHAARIARAPRPPRRIIAHAPPESHAKRPARNQRPSWIAWGAWFESWGDYRRAAAAYGRAFEQRPDPDTAFAAGRAAECAGDVAQALDYYSRLLDRAAGAKSPPEKGTHLWNDTFIAA